MCVISHVRPSESVMPSMVLNLLSKLSPAHFHKAFILAGAF